LTSFVVFTTTFFGVSFASGIIMYFVSVFWFGSQPKTQEPMIKKELKTEPQDTELTNWSDTGRQTPSSQGIIAEDGTKIKDEQMDEPVDVKIIPSLGQEADDEGYGGSSSYWRDSGIGTGRDESDKGWRKRRPSKQNK
jgi:hypothetical protein